jgi:hypothetical protein
MDLLEQMVIGIVAQSLPQGNTLKGVNPADGRVDALISHGVEHVVRRVGNPLVVGLFEVARPLIDGALVAAVGPVALAAVAPKKKQKRVGRASAVVARRGGKKREYTKGGVEILDAEFVDVPNGGKR